MILFLLAFLGGVVTIASPCILPVLPFVFARADRSFLRSGLPMLAGMVLSFAAVATLASVAGGWAVAANEYGRLIAIALLAVFGLALVFPALSDRLMRPLVAAGARISDRVDRDDHAGGFAAVPLSLLLGVATGLLWAPCAGPILGLLLTGAALGGASAETTLLLFAYAAGAATSLALALLVGGCVFAAMKRSLGAGEWVRRGVGVAVLAAVAAIALGLDTGFLTQVSLASTASLEQKLLDTFRPPQQAATSSSVVMTGGPAMMSGSPAMMSGAPAITGGSLAMTGDGSTVMIGNPGMMMRPAPGAAEPQGLPVEGMLPSLGGAVEWLNGAAAHRRRPARQGGPH